MSTIIKAIHQQTKQVISGTLNDVYSSLQTEHNPELWVVQIEDKKLFGEEFLIQYAILAHSDIDN